MERTIFAQHIKARLSTNQNSATVGLSLRIDEYLDNQLEELASSYKESKTAMVTYFIEAGIKELTAKLGQADPNDHRPSKAFLLNTNFTNDPNTHIDMLENQEAAAFCPGWKESIERLSEGDTVYFYQSGVGIIAYGTINSDLIKSSHNGVINDKYSKKLCNFVDGFKPITAKQFRQITGSGGNFRLVLAKLSNEQHIALQFAINDRLNTKK